MPLFRTSRTTRPTGHTNAVPTTHHSEGPRGHDKEQDAQKTRDVDIVINVEKLRKTFETLDTTVVAAAGIDLQIAAGSATALTGPSGSGKSTLLHMIGALERPDSGSITVLGQTITDLASKDLAAYRRRVGFVFQRFNLLPTLTVLDNVLAPVLPFRPGPAVRDRARELLAAVGLEGRDNTLATRMSGGQQQRVAIARALIGAPALVLADEPTGNLDTVTGNEIIELLLGLRDQHDTTLIIATHDPQLARRCDRAIHLRDGAIDDIHPRLGGHEAPNKEKETDNEDAGKNRR